MIAVMMEREKWFKGNGDTWAGCAAGFDSSKWVREPAASALPGKKCRISGPTPDLVNQTETAG